MPELQSKVENSETTSKSHLIYIHAFKTLPKKFEHFQPAKKKRPKQEYKNFFFSLL